MKTQPSYRRATAETAAAITLWALSFSFIKIALQEVSPATLIVLRFAVGGMILLVAAWMRGELRHLNKGDLAAMALLGSFGITLQQLLQVSGQAWAEASAAAFLASTAPAFLVILASVFLKEPVRPWQAAGVIMATSGAAIVATGGRLALAGGDGLQNMGNLLVLLSAIAWAFFTILNRRVVVGRPPISVSAGMMIFGFLFMLPLFVFQRGWQEIPGISLTGWGAILYTAVLSSALAFLLYAHALKLAPASRLAAIQNIEPLIAAGAAVLILNETITWPLAAGGLAIVFGVYLAERPV
jgi:drug/metabolite transporter (DMT)-like permease